MQHCQDLNGTRRRQGICTMSVVVDTLVKRTMDTLQDSGLTNDDYLVVFASDNGGATNLGSSNAPLAGGKASVGASVATHFFSQRLAMLPPLCASFFLSSHR